MANIILPSDASNTGKPVRALLLTGGDYLQQFNIADATGANALSVNARGEMQVNLGSSAGNTPVVTGTLPITNLANSAVTADVSASGNATVSLQGGTFTNLPIIFEASADGGTNWFTIDATQTDGTGINTQLTLPAQSSGPRNWNIACPGYTHIRVRQTAVATSLTAAPTVRINQGPFLVDPSPAIAPIDGQKWTYSSPMNATAAAGVTGLNDMWAIQNPVGSGRTIRVIRMTWSLTLATAAMVNILLARRSTLNTGGTIGGGRVPHDSSNPASIVTVQGVYTVTPTASGTLAGYLKSYRYYAAAVGTTTPMVVEWYFGNRPGQAMTLRPGEQLSLIPAATLATVPTLTGDIEWTEE